MHEGSHLFIYGAGADAGKGKEFEEIGEKSLVVKEVRTSFPSLSCFGSLLYWSSLYLCLPCGSVSTPYHSLMLPKLSAAVAISFINEVDNMVFDAVVSEQLKDFLSKIEYEVPIMSGAGKTSFKSAVYQLTYMPVCFCSPITLLTTSAPTTALVYTQVDTRAANINGRHSLRCLWSN